MSLSEATRERIDSLVSSADVTLFMKGNREAPQCGFSATVVGILDKLIPEYQTVDVLQDHEIREGIKTYSSWPTIPQLYVKGEFVGGCDIIQELFGSGELQETLGVEIGSGAPPSIGVSDRARESLLQALSQSGAPGAAVHLGIDARLRNSLSIGPIGPGEIAVETNGVTIYVDPATAARADGVEIDVVDTDRGPGFRIENPRSPSVQDMTVEELRRRLEAGERLELLDVRTPEERSRAAIPGSTLLNELEVERLEALPRDTTLVFHCHHGGRARSAAEHFASLGFTDVHNVEGGIDAWSQRIDPSVPRY